MAEYFSDWVEAPTNWGLEDVGFFPWGIQEHRFDIPEEIFHKHHLEITWADNDPCDFAEANWNDDDYQNCGPEFRGYCIYHQRDLSECICTNWQDAGYSSDEPEGVDSKEESDF